MNAGKVGFVDRALSVVVKRLALLTFASVLTNLLTPLLVGKDFLLLRLEYLREDGGGVELDPLWSQHEVNMVVPLRSPELEDLAQLELSYDLVR